MFARASPHPSPIPAGAEIIVDEERREVVSVIDPRRGDRVLYYARGYRGTTDVGVTLSGLRQFREELIMPIGGGTFCSRPQSFP